MPSLDKVFVELIPELIDDATSAAASVAAAPTDDDAPHAARHYPPPPARPSHINYEEQGFAIRLRPKVITAGVALTARTRRR